MKIMLWKKREDLEIMITSRSSNKEEEMEEENVLGCTLNCKTNGMLEFIVTNGEFHHML